MKTTLRILSLILIITLLSACTPAPTAAPTAAATPAPTATITLTPTVTPSPAPTQTPTPVMPEIDSWMEPHLQVIGNYEIEVAEDGVLIITTDLENGDTVAVYEYVDGEWRPSYKSMDQFITEDGRFLLDEALDTLVIRKDGEYKLNQEDYTRFMDEVNKIWEEWCAKLETEGMLEEYQDGQLGEVSSGGSRSDYFSGYTIDLRANEEAGKILRVFGAVQVEGSDAILVVIGGADWIVPAIVIPKTQFIYYNDDLSPYPAIELLAGEGEGEVDNAMLLFALDPKINTRFIGVEDPVAGVVDPEVMDELAKWIDAYGHSGMDMDKKEKAEGVGAWMELLIEKGPVVLVSGWADVGE